MAIISPWGARVALPLPCPPERIYLPIMFRVVDQTPISRPEGRLVSEPDCQPVPMYCPTSPGIFVGLQAMLYVYGDYWLELLDQQGLSNT